MSVSRSDFALLFHFLEECTELLTPFPARYADVVNTHISHFSVKTGYSGQAQHPDVQFLVATPTNRPGTTKAHWFAVKMERDHRTGAHVIRGDCFINWWTSSTVASSDGGAGIRQRP